jgi:hypothetical protein
MRRQFLDRLLPLGAVSTKQGRPFVFYMPFRRACAVTLGMALLAVAPLVPSQAIADAVANGILRGRVSSARDGEPLAEANVNIPALARGVLTGPDGRYELTGLPAGRYNVQVALLGYRRRVEYEIEITPVKPVVLDLELEEEALAGDSVLVTASPFSRRVESPVSLRTLGESEIARSPGGDRDLSKVLQTLPGVGSGASFRNDLIVRGGAPSENRFYLDGVEVPNINHFATQGSSGGPVGMINVDFVREVDVYTGAFPAARGNALSSVMDVRMKDGNDARLAGTVTLGTSDAGLTLDGPLGDRGSYILSLRRSYLQWLFKAIGLPFLPTYNDAQFKTRLRIGEHDELELLGLGAIDQLELNTDLDPTELNRYILDFLPETPQWNYALGAVWKRFDRRGYRSVVLSRNELDNRSTKYPGNDPAAPGGPILDYRSRETETKLRLERVRQDGGWRWSWGAGLEHDHYFNATYQQTVTPTGVILVDYESELTLTRGSIFGQAARTLLDGRLDASLGVRADAADYSSATKQALEDLSPRGSLSYALTRRLRLNLNAGRFHQLPAYTVLGYRDGAGTLVNRNAGARPIRSDQLVGGLGFDTDHDARFTLEGFSKRYTRYPFLTRDSISLANLGADFGVIGNAPSAPISDGRAYGIEVLAQQKLRAGWYGIAAYTFVRSEFSTRTGGLAPSAWDARHLVSVTGGRQFRRGWEVGLRWSYQGGLPYTPDDVALSSLKEVWDVSGRAVPDYVRLNTLRAEPFAQLDVRVDKRWVLGARSLDLYLDVQNLLARATGAPPILVVDRDPVTGAPLTDPNDPARYGLHTIAGSDRGTPVPSIGIVFGF